MSFSLPWFIVDFENFDLITLPNVPLEVTSVKQINWAQQAVPGDETMPQQFTGMGPQEISFNIDVIKKSNTVGALPTIKQFEGLRTPIFNILSLIKGGPNRNAQVLFWYGTGNTIPQVYFVTKVDFQNSMYNFLGYPQRSVISMTLRLDEKNVLYTIEKFARLILRILGLVDGVVMLVNRIASKSGERPYSFLF